MMQAMDGASPAAGSGREPGPSLGRADLHTLRFTQIAAWPLRRPALARVGGPSRLAAPAAAGDGR